MVNGDRHMLYLTTGQDHHFWGLEPAFALEGQQAGVVHGGSAKAHAVAGYKSVEVEYELPAAVRVHATLHDAVGRQVGVLDIGEQTAGTHRLSWIEDSQGRKLGAGAYFVLLDTGKEQARLKAVVR
jgi:hypothetical protein